MASPETSLAFGVPVPSVPLQRHGGLGGGFLLCPSGLTHGEMDSSVRCYSPTLPALFRSGPHLLSCLGSAVIQAPPPLHMVGPPVLAWCHPRESHVCPVTLSLWSQARAVETAFQIRMAVAGGQQGSWPQGHCGALPSGSRWFDCIAFSPLTAAAAGTEDSLGEAPEPLVFLRQRGLYHAGHAGQQVHQPAAGGAAA